MKKIITLSTILALSMASVVEAKGFRSVTGKSLSAPRMTTSTKAKDATFTNTPKQATATQQPTANGNRVASFATGAAAGYILSNALAPNTAMANEQAAQPASDVQAVENTQNFANSNNVAQFKSIGGQIDPYLIEKTDGYRRYCISGVQYLAAAVNGSTAPIVMVTPEGKPLTCELVQ